MTPAAEENAGGWRLERLACGEIEIRHVVPVEDALPHRLGLDCPCRPTVDEAPIGVCLIVHFAFDGREWFELRQVGTFADRES